MRPPVQRSADGRWAPQAGQLVDRYDHWGGRLSDYYIVSVADGEVTYLDLKTEKTFSFTVAEHLAFLANPVGSCGRVAWRVVE